MSKFEYKFKTGDKVRCVQAESSYWYAVGDVFTIKSKVMAEEDECELLYQVEEKDIYAYIGQDDFELVKEEANVKEFDLHKDKWFIHTPTPEISEAVQLWLFEQGIGWHTSTASFSLANYSVGHVVMKSPYQDSKFCWNFKDSSSVKQLEAEGKEIKLTFKTVVDTVEYPEPEIIETESQKELRILKEQIDQLTQQANKLETTLKGEV